MEAANPLFHRVPLKIKRSITLSLLLLLVACQSARPTRTVEISPAERQFAADLAFLADDAQEGRGVATQGIWRAADHLVRRFREFGLQPAFGDSYYQRFNATVGSKRGKRTFLSLAGKKIPDDKFSVFGLSSSGTFGAEVVFAGYGISAPEIGYDDYAGLDVKGKTVLILRYEPQITDATSPFNGNAWSEYATFRYKIFNARRHGAAAVVLVTGPLATGDKGDQLVPMQSDPMAGQGFGLSMFHVAQSEILPLLERQNFDLNQVQAAIDADLRPRSRSLGFWASGWADIERESFNVANVGGFLPGVDTSRTIVIGAHYDHLGYGATRSKGSPEMIHNGADDNASGTAGMLELARRYASAGTPPVNLLFLGFSAEESGLVGSTYFVQNSPVPLSSIAAMLNLDMIGRMRNDTVTVFGVGSAREFPAIITAVTRPGVKIVRKKDGFGPSDHAPFYGAGVPVLHFFSGTHENYHTPTDTFETVNIAGAMQIVDLVGAVVAQIGAQPALAYLGPDRQRALYAGVEVPPGGPYLGVLPAFSSDSTGVVVAGVRAKSPAVGLLQVGDQLVGFDSHEIANYYELAYFLRSRSPGELVELTYRRNGQLRRAAVRLGQAD